VLHTPSSAPVVNPTAAGVRRGRVITKVSCLALARQWRPSESAQRCVCVCVFLCVCVCALAFVCLCVYLCVCMCATVKQQCNNSVTTV
jgi:hypothetical protein